MPTIEKSQDNTTADEGPSAVAKITKLPAPSAMLFSKNDFKNDAYLVKRGGPPNMLQLFCTHCDSYVITYQKDDIGELKRCYLDRILHPAALKDLDKKGFDVNSAEDLICQVCAHKIAQPIIYAPEDRPAYKIIKDQSYYNKCKL
jgi:hypothetical protein